MPGKNLSKQKLSWPARFLRKPFSEQRLAAEAFFWIGITSFVIRFLPFRALVRLAGQPSRHLINITDGHSGHAPIIQSIRKTVVTVSRRVPWQSKCLVQASAAKIMLGKRGIPSEACLGVSESGMRGNSRPGERVESANQKDMRPHAWLIVNGEAIIGGENLDDYVAVTRF